MTPPLIHREDIKAALRKKFGSILNFEKKYGLSYRSVTDALGGKRRPTTERIIAEVLGHSVEDLFGCAAKSAVADSSTAKSGLHYPKTKAA